MKFALILAMAATVMSLVAAADDLSSYVALDTGGVTTLLVAYADEDGHNNIVSETLNMQAKGMNVKETNRHDFKKKRSLKSKGKGKDGGKGKKAKAKGKEKGSRFLQEGASTSGYSVIEIASDDFKADVHTLSKVKGVVAIEVDATMHVLSTDYQKKLRGGSATDHMNDIQEAIKTAADQLSVEDEAKNGRRLAEESPYGIGMVRADEVWGEDPPAGAQPITICVVDTGYDDGHDDLPSSTAHGVDGFTPSGSTYSGQVWSVDGHGHGTHCAGTIGAIGENDIGVTSVNPDPSKFKFYIGKGLSDSGSGTGAGVMDSVQACVDAGAKVISMSLGGGGFSPTSNAQYQEHYDDNVLIIAAAGNGASSAYSYPASYETVVSIAAVDSNKNKAWFSQYNDQVELSGPGVSVKSTWKNNAYNTISGTSMATPHVAGVAALLWYHFPDCTNNQIRNAMINSAEDLGSPNWDSGYGWGLVDAKAAYDLLSQGCVVAGGPYPDTSIDESLSDQAKGGENQGPIGPTPPPTPAPTFFCSSFQEEVKVSILTDNWPGETTWTVTEKCSDNDVEMMSGGPYSSAGFNVTEYGQVCSVGVYEFEINDAYGDGICCGYGQGAFEVTFGGDIVAEGGDFGSSETVTFGSGSCDEPSTPPPTTAEPTSSPTNSPSKSPTVSPSSSPTQSPTTAEPTTSPTNSPSKSPTASPSSSPTQSPTTAEPTTSPTNLPTPVPSSPPTAPPSSAPSSSPTVDPNSAQPQDASFDSAYGVPRCANVGSECDSLQLLRGRGTINNGVEQNRSNTNLFGPSCNDGNSGSFHSDESIDKIIVTAGDVVNGSPVPSGDFIVEGGRAYVSVDVWCWGSGASDSADIYLASDASSPNWQHLNTIGCPGGGGHTLVQAFDVPQGANQSIRVNFRYRGNQSPCSNGSWDDHDDLVFAVKNNPALTSAPTPSPAPTNEGNSGPQTATFDSGFGAPKCSFGSSCDSGILLRSRGTISGRIEPNRPNTLVNTGCSDGNSGTFHSDESIDKIVVSGDGVNDFKVGDSVTVTATIWCWSSGSSDYIDFYYTSDAGASNPVWTKIGQRQQCPGGQLQTVSRSYTLPEGGLQAVRVNLMYGSGNPGANKCTSGSWDDTDDLVISVKPNPNAASLSIASAMSKDDFAVQGAIEVMARDEGADAAMASLQAMNKAEKKPKGGDGSDKKGGGKGKKKAGKKKAGAKKKGKDGGGADEGGASTGKFICARKRPSNDEIICDEGSESLPRCVSEGDRCGKKKYCYYSACDMFETDS